MPSGRSMRLALGVGLGVAAGCTAGHQELPADAVTLAVKADVTGFFPDRRMVSEAFTTQLNRSIYEGLVGFDRRLQPVPRLAESWTNPDDRTYVFELRPGLLFSDGAPVTAADVAASLEAGAAPGGVNRDYLQSIESARVVGRRSVLVRTRYPYRALLTRLPWGFVVPARDLARPGGGAGTGPYRVERWLPGRELVLARNPRFRGTPAPFRTARFVIVPDDSQRLALLERGQADVVDHVPLEALPRLEARRDLRVIVSSGLRVLFLGLRVDAPPFADPRVREAVDLAIDRPELVRRALAGRAEVATQLVPRAVIGHDPELKPTSPDRGRARQLLAEAGYTGGFAIRLDGPSNRYVNDRQILVELGRQLREVGLQVEVNPLDKRVFFPLIESGRSQVYLLGFACESGDAGDLLGGLLHSRQGAAGALNTFGLADPELDSLILRADGSQGDAERADWLRRALRRAAELRAALPLVIQTEAVAVSPHISWDPPLNLSLQPEDMAPRSSAQ